MKNTHSTFWDSKAIKTFGSLGLAASMMSFLLLLTLLGTLEQMNMGIYQVQKKYFESLFVTECFGYPIFLPGGMLCMVIFTLNLMVGGILRLRLNKNNIGVFIIHVGIALMMSAGLVKLMAGQEGYLRLLEGDKSSEYVSHHEWEIAVFEDVPGEIKEYTLHERHWRHSDAKDTPEALVMSGNADLPFDLHLDFMHDNCMPEEIEPGNSSMDSTYVLDGWTLSARPMDAENERNLPGLRIWTSPMGSNDAQEISEVSFLYGGQYLPWTFQAEGKDHAVALRKVRHSMPFSIELDNFEKVDYPGISMAKEFRSDVTQASNGTSRKVRIEMNDPLRDQGLILFQSSWGPPNAKPGDTLYSVFAVVHNPSDHWPLYSCIIIGIGMALTFTQKFVAYGRRQSKRRKESPDEA